MEEDAGQLTHPEGATGRSNGAEFSLADHNRAGVPLVEIVTKPIMGTDANPQREPHSRSGRACSIWASQASNSSRRG